MLALRVWVITGHFYTILAIVKFPLFPAWTLWCHSDILSSNKPKGKLTECNNNEKHA